LRQRISRRQRQASRRAQARLAPITEPGTPEEVTVISAGQARTERWHRDRGGERDIEARDRDLQRLARTDLHKLCYQGSIRAGVTLSSPHWLPDRAVTDLRDAAQAVS
jgi:hypothetical protein